MQKPPDHNNIEKTMNYLTNYYKNLSEQLQERINILEAFIRSPTQQGDAVIGYPRIGLLPREEQMIHFQAALEISEPHEKEAIEAVLTDMAQSEGRMGSRGSAANMQSLRTAVGAVKRLKGSEQFEKSLAALQEPIKKKGAEYLDRERFYRFPTSISDDSWPARLTQLQGAEEVVLGSRRPKREPNTSTDAYAEAKARDEQRRMERLEREEKLRKQMQAKGRKRK